MIKGQRCRATRHLTAHQGVVKAQSTGTIEFETENLDRRLISVQWDGSFQMYVFPDEIEWWIHLSLIDLSL
jgi:ribose 1,5-bisphosphokinase PhnN